MTELLIYTVLYDGVNELPALPLTYDKPYRERLDLIITLSHEKWQRK